jgi:hypothetical protein
MYTVVPLYPQKIDSRAPVGTKTHASSNCFWNNGKKKSLHTIDLSFLEYLPSADVASVDIEGQLLHFNTKLTRKYLFMYFQSEIQTIS